ncbi:hypothetical protein BJ912DRAFT_588356 [Pholiota molesta]|nr:hypothetical protein BJ912DRAFT_588356 [Pholiota molesta]
MYTNEVRISFLSLHSGDHLLAFYRDEASCVVHCVRFFLNRKDGCALRVVGSGIAHENPVEDKHRRLVRSHRSSPYDRELKPNAKIRDELGVILSYSPSQPLTSEEKDLIWKFRFYQAVEELNCYPCGQKSTR